MRGSWSSLPLALLLLLFGCSDDSAALPAQDGAVAGDGSAGHKDRGRPDISPDSPAGDPELRQLAAWMTGGLQQREAVEVRPFLL